MNILFAVDRGYLEQLKTCVHSVLRSGGAEKYEFYILHSDLDERDQRNIKEWSEGRKAVFHFTEVDPVIFSAFPETDRYPVQIYYRIFAAMILPKELDRILYLDADTVVINSLRELYDMDFEGHFYLACTHVRSFLNKVNKVRLDAKGEIAYVNTGMLLMNLKELREKQTVKEVLHYVEKRKNVFILPDQDIISALYGEKIRLLPSEIYNLSDRILAFHNADPRNEKIDAEWVRIHTVVIHYCGKKKPWKKGYRGILGIFYREALESSSQEKHDFITG